MPSTTKNLDLCILEEENTEISVLPIQTCPPMRELGEVKS